MAVTVVASAFVAILASGTGPAAPVVTAIATPPAIRFAERVAAEWRRKSNVVAESALAAYRLNPEDFCEALTADPDMIALTQQVPWAASVSGSDQKLRALGDLLGRAAACPGDRLDETQVLVAALRDLEGPHLLILEVLTGPAPGKWENGSVIGWLPDQVSARVNLDPEFVPACLSALTRHGLATTVGVLDGGQRFVVTRPGQAIALAMRGMAREPDQGA